MILFAIGLASILALFVAFGFTKEKVSEFGKVKETLTWKTNPKQFIALAGLLVVALSCVTSVPTGHTGIVTTFGKVEDYTFEAGVHFKMPWQDVVKMDNRNQKGSLSMTCFSSDIQEVSMVYSINYQIEKANAQEIYRSIGTSYYDTVMVPHIQEAVKSVVAQYTAEELIESRNELSDKIMADLTGKLADYNIVVLSTAVEDMDFTDAFTNAVEQKQVAQQNKLRAETEAEQARIVAEAEAAGAIMLFGEKYGDKVRIVNFGPSTELCGGTHTAATGTIGLFKIVSESAISAGVRRIEAVTGEIAEDAVYNAQDMISSLEHLVHNPKLVQAIEKIIDNNNALTREVEEMRKEKVTELANRLSETPIRDGVRLISHSAKYQPEMMKDLAFALRQRVEERLVMVIGNVSDGKPTLNIMLSDDIVAAGVDAGAVVREAAKLINGGGGGQKHYATAGGKSVDGMQEAIDKAVALIMEKLN